MTQERARNSRGKRAISVRATEVLLYNAQCALGKKFKVGDDIRYVKFSKR